ncbi:hypothetical protein ACTI_84810 [Actinoplanes sp. OR16]|nr:hypothetical protein ACTI_84810 [Actinoplanes sp. OR16]
MTPARAPAVRINHQTPVRIKRTGITTVASWTAEDLTAVATEFDNRPRKILGGDSPAQRFTRSLTEAA